MIDSTRNIDKNETYIKVYRFLVIAFSFFLPFRADISSTICFLLLIFFLFDFKNVKNKLKIAIHCAHFKVFILVFLMHFIGLFYTSNFKYAITDIEIKISLLILPMIILGEKRIGNNELRKSIYAFVFGCLIAGIISFIIATNSYFQTRDINSFLYGGLAFVMHSSYFSMYLMFSIALIISYILKEEFQNKNLIKKTFFYAVILFFVLLIILLSSRAGLLALLLSGLIYMIFLITKRKFKLPTIIFLGGLIMLILLFQFAPQSLQRFKSLNSETITYNDPTTGKIDYNKKDPRLAIAELSSQLIFKSPIIGVGTGDVKDVLLEKYKSVNFVVGFDKKLNCHNQFIQFLVAFGFFGFFIFLFVLFRPMVAFFKQKKYFFGYFVFLISFNFLFESMLETKAGVEFFSFFYVLLLLDKTDDSIIDS
jgi:O-antigen ligase